MTPVEFRLLGAMELRVDGQVVPLPGTAGRALLALLLLSPGRTVATTSLIDRLWSESALPSDPINALHLRVSKLRRTLEAHGLDLVVREASGYRADVAPWQVDIHLFADRVAAARAATRSGRDGASALELYEEALSLWRGEPLAEFAGAGWASVEAARLQQLHILAVTEHAEAALAAGRHLEIAADLGPVVAGNPGQEPLAGLLMTALYRGGRQADALEVFERTRRWLSDELGLRPSPALRTLHRRIVQEDAELAALPKAAIVAPAAIGARDVTLAARRLIGRDDAVRSIADLLHVERLVTLVGPGGAGKTSLALVVAQEAAARFDQVRVARLAAITDPGDVPLAVADALGVPLDGADPNARVRDRLLGYLANRRLLLVLDNCEHVIDAAALLLDAVLPAAPGVTVLATSREALAVSAEVQVSVAPLEPPPPGTPPQAVLDFPAAQLFLERARAVRPGLVPDDADLAALAAISRCLDGMPLALELAAARVSSLSLVELSERLQDGFGLLTTGSRTAEARQRTLRATVEWSHDLLTPSEKRLFRRLAVFQGGWTLEAAEAVAAGPADAGPGANERAEVLDLLARLVDRSMVVADHGPRTRYRMLETLRHYALEQLHEADEMADARERHALYFRRFAEAAEPGLRGRGQRDTVRRLREEHANLRAALDWLSAEPARIEEALRLAGALGLYWHLGRHVEGRAVLRRLVAVSGGSTETRARALQAVSLVERPRGCLVHPSPRCGETAAESLDLFVKEADPRRAALSRVLLAVEYVDGSNPERFESLLREAETEFVADEDEWGQAVVAFVRLQSLLRSGDERRARAVGQLATEAFRRLDDAWGLSAVLYHLGWGLREFGRYGACVPVLEQAIEVSRAAGMHNTAQWAVGDLGMALLYLGETTAAAERFAQARAASDEIGDGAGQILASLGEAVMARIRGDGAAARRAFEEAEYGLRRLGTPLWAGNALAGLAWCDWYDGSYDVALERYGAVLRAGAASGEPALTASGLEGLARVAAASGDRVGAAEHLARAADVRRRASRPAPPHERAELAALGIPVPEAPGGADR